MELIEQQFDQFRNISESMQMRNNENIRIYTDSLKSLSERLKVLYDLGLSESLITDSLKKSLDTSKVNEIVSEITKQTKSLEDSVKELSKKLCNLEINIK